MTVFRGFSRIFLPLFGAVALFASVSGAQASPATEKFAQDVVDRGYTILNNTSLSDAERRRQFRDFMFGLTDFRRIAVFTLGQYARSASPAEVDDFVNAFGEYAVAVYEWRLGKYRGQTLKVVGSNDTPPDDSVVNTVVVNPAAPNAAPIRAAFRVRNGANGKPIITDMQVEGIWLAINQRSDFTAFLQQNGGKVPALTANLRAQTVMITGMADLTK